MDASSETLGVSSRVFEVRGLSSLFDGIRASGYRLLGPTVKDGAIVLDEIASTSDLPAGVGQEQANGHYRLRDRGDAASFGYTVGPHAWKRFLFPAARPLFRATRESRGFRVDAEEPGARPDAFVGVRPCDLAAIGRLDRVLAGGAHEDPSYRARREAALVVVVQCTEPESTCFCASLGTGPRAPGGFDLALTELFENGRHEFLVEVGSPRGEALLADAPSRPAAQGDLAAARASVRRAEAGMGRALDADGIKELLAASVESSRWEEIARRCLSCANCTMVCPTCFCTAVEDASDLAGTAASRSRLWDSCYTLDFTYIHGGSIRRSAAARYRQWMSHKLSTWVDQFGETGCVGCGRCITWCPVGIDITEEARALRDARPTPAA